MSREAMRRATDPVAPIEGTLQRGSDWASLPAKRTEEELELIDREIS